MTVPAISVLMPAYNAAEHIEQSIGSLLQQTFTEFEIIVVDDGSTDDTWHIVGSISDSRIRLIQNPRNMGVVWSGNHGLSQARAPLIARLDADDYCMPRRLEVQARFLDDNPHVQMVGTGGITLTGDRFGATNTRPEPDPTVLRWMFQITNPIGHSSVMFRRSVIDRLGEYMRGDFQYAEDFDFFHRILDLGTVAMISDRLVVYRRRPHGMSRTGLARVIGRTTAVLSERYPELIGSDAAAAAAAVASHLMAGQPARTVKELQRLGGFLEALSDAFERKHAPSDEQRGRMRAVTADFWWRAVAASLRSGAVGTGLQGFRAFPSRFAFRPRLLTLAKALAVGLVRPIPTAPPR